MFFQFFSSSLLATIGYEDKLYHVEILLIYFSWAGLSYFGCGLSKGDGKNRVRVVGNDLNFLDPGADVIAFSSIAPDGHDLFMWALSVDIHG